MNASRYKGQNTLFLFTFKLYIQETLKYFHVSTILIRNFEVMNASRYEGQNTLFYKLHMNYYIN
jgi:hypothetical protein